MLLKSGLLSGIEYLNSEGYIHRDIKPDNILIQKGINGKELHAGSFKICDFGLIMKEHDKNSIYKRCGTPGFVPPEIVKVENEIFDQVVSKKWDTFSTGVILYMLISKN